MPADHPLWRVDRVLDLAAVRAQLAPCDSRLGRPSVDPEVLLRPLLVGDLFGITSERRLVDEVRVTVACRWGRRDRRRATAPETRTSSLAAR